MIETKRTLISLSTYFIQTILIPITITAQITLLTRNFFGETRELKQAKKQILYSLQTCSFLEDPKKAKEIFKLAQKTLTPTEQFIILDLLPYIDSSVIKDILCGGNVQIHDGGFFYERWRKLPSVQARSSSHQHEKKKAGSLTSPIYKQFLFWKNKNNSDTYFQLERNALSWKKCLQSILHFDNYLSYLKTGKQIGPLGRSIYTEKYPILICPNLKNFQKDQQKMKENLDCCFRDSPSKIE